MSLPASLSMSVWTCSTRPRALARILTLRSAARTNKHGMPIVDNASTVGSPSWSTTDRGLGPEQQRTRNQNLQRAALGVVRRTFGCGAQHKGRGAGGVALFCCSRTGPCSAAGRQTASGCTCTHVCMHRSRQRHTQTNILCETKGGCFCRILALWGFGAQAHAPARVFLPAFLQRGTTTPAFPFPTHRALEQQGFARTTYGKSRHFMSSARYSWKIAMAIKTAKFLVKICRLAHMASQMVNTPLASNSRLKSSRNHR